MTFCAGAATAGPFQIPDGRHGGSPPLWAGAAGSCLFATSALWEPSAVALLGPAGLRQAWWEVWGRGDGRSEWHWGGASDRKMESTAAAVPREGALGRQWRNRVQGMGGGPPGAERGGRALLLSTLLLSPAFLSHHPSCPQGSSGLMLSTQQGFRGGAERGQLSQMGAGLSPGRE